MAELTPYLDAWRKLAGGAPMRSPAWLLAWWETFAGSGDVLHVILVVDAEGALVGLAPMYRQNAEAKAVLRLLGAQDNCTHHNDWLSAPGWELQVGKEVAHALLQCRQDWLRMVFEAVDADATAIRATLGQLAAAGCLSHQRPIHNRWKISLPESWDDYLQMLSRSLRKRCRKLQRDFFNSGKISIRQAGNESELREGLAVLLQLHAKRWGSDRQPYGVFSDPKFRSFHETVSKALLNDRQLRLTWLECHGQPIAVEYQFYDDQTVYAYQAGLDLTMAEYEPGKLSMMAAIQFALARGCQSFDLLGGDEPYKANWRAIPTACHDLRVWQPGLRGYLEHAAWDFYTLAARRLKTVLPDPVINKFCKLWNSFREVCEPSHRSG